MAVFRRTKDCVCSRSVKEPTVQEMVAEYTAKLNRPHPGIMFEAVDIIVEKFSPRAVIIYGATAMGYVDDRKVSLVVIVDGGDTRKLWGDMVCELAYNQIYGDVTVYTEDQFNEYSKEINTVAYDAVRTGFVAYEARLLPSHRLRDRIGVNRRSGLGSYAGTCYHCQQYAEKILKQKLRDFGAENVQSHTLMILAGDLALLNEVNISAPRYAALREACACLMRTYGRRAEST